MASIDISGDNLVIHIHGWDKLIALRSTLTIPLAHVKHAVARPGDARFDEMEGVRIAGGYWPGSFAAGYFWVTGGLGGPGSAALERLTSARTELERAGKEAATALAHLDDAIGDVKRMLEAAKLPEMNHYLAFYDVHEPAKTIGFDVEHERLRRVVIQLDEEDPDVAVARVLAVIGGSAR